MTIKPTINAKYITTSYGVEAVGCTRHLHMFETKDGTLFCTYGLGTTNFEQGRFYEIDLTKLAAGEDVNYFVNEQIRLRKFYASLEKVEA